MALPELPLPIEGPVFQKNGTTDTKPFYDSHRGARSDAADYVDPPYVTRPQGSVRLIDGDQ